MHSTDAIKAGWWVVKAVYYRLCQRSPRGYVLCTVKDKQGNEVLDERLLVVNHLIRLPKPVEFAQFGAVRRTPRIAEHGAQQTKKKLDNPTRVLYDTEYYKFESSMPSI